MRLSLWLFVCLLYLQYPTNSFGKAQAEKRVTLSGTFTLHNFFLEIQKQTGKRVYYTNSILNDEEKVTVNVTNVALQEALEQVFKNKDLEWSIDDKNISIRRLTKHIDPLSKNSYDSTILVSGIVTNVQGEPVAGATVMVKGTQTGSTTNSDGSFTLNRVRPNASLIISNIAFLTKELPVGGKSALGRIALQKYVGTLDETQIIAYGQTSRRYSTGNVTTVKASEIGNQPVTNPLLALQGRVPGMTIEQSNGFTGTGVKIRIQGQNSINSGNDPFIVIDGVPYASETRLRIDIFGSGSNTLSWLNPADIESIDILKDADATAIYGSRAANGAILITTKKGKVGQTRVSASVQRGFSDISKMPKLLNTNQYLEIRKEAFSNAGEPLPKIPNISNYDLTVWDQSRNTNWQKELLGGHATYTDVQSSVSGGTTGTQFLIGTSYHKETTVMPGDLYDKKNSVHFSINNASANKKFKINLSTSYLINRNKIPTTDYASFAARLTPNAPALYNSDGSLNWAPYNDGNTTISTWENPLVFLLTKRINRNENLITNATVGYEILPGLQIRSSFGYNRMFLKESIYYPLEINKPEDRPFRDRISRINENNTSSWIVEPQIQYARSFSKGKIDLLVGGTNSRSESSYEAITAIGFNSDLLLEDLKSAERFEVASDFSEYKYAALFGRLNLNWSDKYILNLTARRDGSSKFGIKNRYHNFYSIAGAWIFSSEDAVKTNFTALSFGKIRASFGTTGNDQIGDYSYLNNYSSNPFPVLYQGITGLSTFALPNPYLQWEKTIKLQGGLDLGFIQDRLLLNLTYFRNKSSNQLLGYDLPFSTGFGSINTNFPATIQNSGLEIVLNTANLRGKYVNWTTSINVTIPKNKLATFPGLETSSYANELIIGQPLGIQKVYHSLGVNPQSGLLEFEKKDGDKTSMDLNDQDKYVLINTLPKYYGGIINTISYKSIEISFLFQFTNQISRSDLRLVGFSPTNALSDVLDRWQKPGDISKFQKRTSNFLDALPEIYAQSSDAIFVKSSYVRFKNVSVSWNIPKSVYSKLKFQSIRLYAQGQNLFTITNYPAGDPESKNINSMAPLRTITSGIQIEF